MSSNDTSGQLHNSSPVIIGFAGTKYPCTVTLKSAAPGRLIRLSTDGGVEFFIPAMDQSSPTQIVLAITAPVSHVEFTGLVGDTWRVL